MGIKEKFSNAGLKDKLGIQEDQGENKIPDGGAVGTVGTVVAAGAVGATQGPVTLSEAEVNSKIHDLFARYDLDSSGTLNTKDELEQLCYNLAFKLKLENSTKDMDAYLNQVPELNDANAWDEATFAQWFKKNILQQS